MKNNKIKFLIYITIITSLFGCTNEKIELNQIITVSEDVKADTEPTLKVVSEETIYFDDAIKGTILYKNGELILRDYSTAEEGIGSSTIYHKININGESASLEFINEAARKNINWASSINWSFIVEETDDNSVKIVAHDNLDGYLISNDLISNGESYYKLIDHILLEQNYYNPNNVIKWYNLNNNTSGIVDLPYGFVATGYAEALGNKVLIHALEDTENSWPVDTLVTIDTETNKIDKEIVVGDFIESLTLDEDRILLLSEGTKHTLDIYDVKNKTRKTLIEYKYTDEGIYNGIEDLGSFNNKDKIYFTVSEDSVMKIKIASINNLEFDEIITVYEKEFDDKSGLSIPQVIFTEDNKELIVYQSNKDGEITEFKIIKLSK